MCSNFCHVLKRFSKSFLNVVLKSVIVSYADLVNKIHGAIDFAFFTKSIIYPRNLLLLLLWLALIIGKTLILNNMWLKVRNLNLIANKVISSIIISARISFEFGSFGTAAGLSLIEPEVSTERLPSLTQNTASFGTTWRGSEARLLYGGARGGFTVQPCRGSAGCGADTVSLSVSEQRH